MIKQILRGAVPLLTITVLFSQDYVMFQTSILELRDGQVSKLIEGVKKHNDKYHNGKDRPKAYLWYINSGQYSGSFSWATGPIKFSHLDDALPADHIKDWERNVSPYADEKDIIYMIRNEELTYNPENETVGENILMKRFYVTNGPGRLNAVMEAVGSITKVLEKTNANIARRVYVNRFPNDGEFDVMLVYPFKSWKSFEGGPMLGLPAGFSNDYEKVYGKGSWQKNIANVLSENTYKRTNEVMTMVK